MPDRVIPGVQVTVVKDVVVPQLSPAGVLGVVGLVETPSAGVQRCATWRRFEAVYGKGSGNSMPEARAALENGVTELVVVPVAADSAVSARGSLPLGADGSLALVARAPGSWANGVAAAVTHKQRGGQTIAFDLELRTAGQATGEGELFQSLQLLPGFSRSLGEVLAARGGVVVLDASQSGTVSADGVAGVTLTEGQTQTLLRLGNTEAMRLRASQPVQLTVAAQPGSGTAYTVTLTRSADGTTLLSRAFDLRSGPLLAVGEIEQGCPDAGALFHALDSLPEVDVELTLWPTATTARSPRTLSGGQDASSKAYIDALDALRDEPDVDLVCAAVQLPSPADEQDRATRAANLLKTRLVYSAIVSHCELMAGESKGRLGFGQVPPGSDVTAGVELADSLVSDRFVLVSPHGAVGAVAGRVGSLPYFQSPTMKTLAGLAQPSARHGQEDQKALLTGRLVPVALERGRGVVVVKGITTDGEQLSVRRVADRASRGVRLIGELFIGRLNNADGRAALRQKLSEFLVQMQRDGAIVPSTDGQSPAFQLDVYSSQDDFSKGIVRVDLAVRPVRAIDYIYATLLVQV